MPANYVSSAPVNAEPDAVFEACLRAVPQCGFRVLGSSPETGQIDARSGMGLRSWGENITITVSKGRVDIKSSCRGFQMVDYGKNKANVNELFAALGQLLAASPQR